MLASEFELGILECKGDSGTAGLSSLCIPNEVKIGFLSQVTRYKNHSAQTLISDKIGLFRTGHMVKETSKVSIQLVVYVGKHCHDGIW